MTINRYKSDAIYRDAVQRYYVLAFFGGFFATIPIQIVIILFRQYVGDSFVYWLLAIPAVHLVVWIIMGAVMCAQFRLMAYDDPPTPPEEPAWYVPNGDGTLRKVKPGDNRVGGKKLA